MISRWVVNSSPLILLGKIDRVELLVKLSKELVIPAAVEREVRAQPEGDGLLAHLVAFDTVAVAAETTIAANIGAWDLGAGESQVLALAVQMPQSRAVLDDLEARRCASSLSVPVIGTLGIILRAKSEGLIASARPVVNQLRAVGLYVTDDLIERALAHLGE
jgi:predicted nucleic acid-binding protein